jgi:hypothetical protein
MVKNAKNCSKIMRREEKPQIYFSHARRAPENTWSEMHRKERYVTSHMIGNLLV